MSNPPSKAVLGVDYGTVRIGLALGFLDSGLVVQLPVLANPGNVAEAVASLASLAKEKGATRVVVGNPVYASGDPSAMSRKVAVVAEALRAEGLDVALQDERRTSVDAEEQLSAMGLRWWQYDKGQVDTLAAMAIVRAYMLNANPGLALLDEEPPEPPPPRESRRDRRRRARRKR